MENISTKRRLRICNAITVYSLAAKKPIDENLFIDMVMDLLWYCRQEKIEPAAVCKQVMNNDSRKVKL